MKDTTLYRLADHTAVEALVNRWVAWPHTFSPAPHCLHMANYQVKTLESYLQNPEIHVKSSHNPKLLGGPFVDVAAERAHEVEALLHDLQHNHTGALEFAKTLIEFQNTLVNEATGQGINAFYSKIPECLGGYVELLYDYFERPHVRCLESVLYASSYYRKDLQSLTLFSQTHDDARAYYMSTPRLPQADSVEWQLPFEDSRVDGLFELDAHAEPLGAIRELLGLPPSEDYRLLPLLTEAPGTAREPWCGNTLRIRYFGHACVLVECNGVSILTDPFIPVIPSEGGIERYSFQDLPAQIDFVLISHAHHDHFVFESLLRLRHRIGCVVVPKSSGMFYGDVSLKLMAQKIGFRNIYEIDSLDSISIPGGEIVGAPFFGEHSDLPHAKSAYIVRFGSEQILFAADSNCLDYRVYQHLCKALGPVGTVFLGMEFMGAPLSWVYGPLLPQQPQHKHNMSRRSNGSDAKAASTLLSTVGAERVYVYAIGREPWLKYFMALTPEDGDPYIKESDKVLDTARNSGFRDAQRPYGKLEFHLSV
ncbi:MBL fold metallo-hydrolase [Candidatus Methylospira mobilis]|uniref:MBL fold metallo-hydrolase n=1 Tax=Candidatus Methylospira mobilis TaxID=1808979 RepID=A0A5Q0BN46_9GAMM|nr:MBL fold metallo-hydrolase [Candidatus Methylospira mobilis]QFY44572.1 MBL fold metallo-hydrolase [Candidatus Methylospira mobilis]